MMTRLLSRLRKEDGQAGFEGIIVFPAWLLTTTLFVNLLFFLGSAMLMQSSTNRAALQASALGCLNDSVAADVQNRRGLGINSGVIVTALTTAEPAPGPGTPGDQGGYYDIPADKFVDSNGNARAAGSGLIDASCAGTNSSDQVTSGKWIFVQVRYKQNLWVFGQREVRRDALVISHNLQR